MRIPASMDTCTSALTSSTCRTLCYGSVQHWRPQRGAKSRLGLACLLIAQAYIFSGTPVWANPGPSEDKSPAISTAAFSDIMKHWKDKNRNDKAKQYEPENYLAISENLLLYQRNNGGWPVNKNPLRILTEQEIASLKTQKHWQDTSLDNRNTYPQIHYLAQVHLLTKAPHIADAVKKGLRYLFAAQLPNGGWTHSPPRTDKYYGHITIMDDVMTGTLRLLRQINQGAPEFAFLPEALKQKARVAQTKGDALLLELQIIQSDQPSLWAGQYHPKTLKPVTGRSFELPGLVTRESVEVIRYLMEQPTPDLRTQNTIHSAMAWLKSAAIHNIRLERVPVPKVDYTYHSADYDWRVVPAKLAPPMWARFYELAKPKPFFANRNGVKVFQLKDVHHERRTGYEWYGTWAQNLLNQQYPAWQDTINQ